MDNLTDKKQLKSFSGVRGVEKLTAKLDGE